MIKCNCGCNRYYEECRNGVKDDYIAQSLYCNYGHVGAFGNLEGYPNKCKDCNLVNYGMDCKNNKIDN